VLLLGLHEVSARPRERRTFQASRAAGRPAADLDLQDYEQLLATSPARA